jgi:hypothetical protein
LVRASKFPWLLLSIKDKIYDFSTQDTAGGFTWHMAGFHHSHIVTLILMHKYHRQIERQTEQAFNDLVEGISETTEI